MLKLYGNETRPLKQQQHRRHLGAALFDSSGSFFVVFFLSELKNVSFGSLGRCPKQRSPSKTTSGKRTRWMKRNWWGWSLPWTEKKTQQKKKFLADLIQIGTQFVGFFASASRIDSKFVNHDWEAHGQLMLSHTAEELKCFQTRGISVVGVSK